MPQHSAPGNYSGRLYIRANSQIRTLAFQVQVKDHVLLPWASELDEIDNRFRSVLTPERIRAVVSLVPDEWLSETSDEEVTTSRQAYIQFLETRLQSSHIFVNEAKHAREVLV